VFSITVSATSAFGVMGFSLNSAPSTGSWANRHSNTRVYVQAAGTTASWTVHHNGGSTTLDYNVSTTRRDYRFNVYITSESTCDVELIQDATTKRVYNVAMSGTSGANISHVVLYFNDDWNGSSNQNIYWKQTTQHQATGTVNLGYYLGSGTYTPGLITNGLTSTSTSTASANAVNVGGNAGSNVTLSENNTYTGLTTVNANATCKLGASGGSPNTPLGTTAAGTSISSGGVLDLNGFSLGTTESLTLNGTGIASGGALVNSSSTSATWQGAITLGSGTRITASGTGGLTLSGSLSGGSHVLYAGGAHNTSLNGVFSGSGNTQDGTVTSLFKDGSGTLTLNSANTYTGDTRVNAGTLTVGSGSNLGSGSDLFIASSGIVNINQSCSVASVQERGNNNGGSLNLGSGATLTISGGSGTVYQSTVSGSGNLIVDAAGLTESLYGNNSCTGNLTVNAGTVALGGSNQFGLVTVGGGTLNLQRSGGTTLLATADAVLSSGSLNISQNQTLDDVTISGGTLTIDAGVTLTINGILTVGGGTITNNGTIAYGASGALVYGSSARTVGAEWPASSGPLNITIGSGGVTLGLARTIASTGKLTLNGVFATGGNLTLASDASGTSVVVGGSNSDLTGNVTVQRFLPWSGANHNGFRFVGHPLRANPALNVVTNLPSAANTVIGYNNASNSYTAVSDRTTTWPQAIGYGVWTGGATNTLSFSGELQLDAVPAVAMGTATNRWNYAANPFPSVMDWHEVTKTNIEGTIYRWDKSTATLSAGSNLAAGTWGTYVVATTTAANGGSRYMAPMQGFMVQATSGASSASLAYPSSARVDQSATYVRQQQNADVARARVTHQASGFGLETVLCFLPQASNTYDANLEARYVSDGVSASQDLYTRDAQGQTYSIQSLPELALNAQTRIPLHLENTQAGAAYTWTMDLSGLTTGHQAWLEDTRLGTLTPVVAGQTQPFTAQAGDAVDRFHLVFAAQGTSVQGLDPHEKVTALVSDGRLNLRGLRQTPARLSWMDLSGRVLGHETLNDPDQVLTCPSFLQEGQYYLLSVRSPQGSYHFRLRR
jgi:autotransporter-associated beta strand protein